MELTSPVRKQNTHGNIEIGGAGADPMHKMLIHSHILFAPVFPIITGKVNSVNSLISMFFLWFLWDFACLDVSILRF